MNKNDRDEKLINYEVEEWKKNGYVKISKSKIFEDNLFEENVFKIDSGWLKKHPGGLGPLSDALGYDITDTFIKNEERVGSHNDRIEDLKTGKFGNVNIGEWVGKTNDDVPIFYSNLYSKITDSVNKES